MPLPKSLCRGRLPHAERTLSTTGRKAGDLLTVTHGGRCAHRPAGPVACFPAFPPRGGDGPHVASDRPGRPGCNVAASRAAAGRTGGLFPYLAHTRPIRRTRAPRCLGRPGRQGRRLRGPHAATSWSVGGNVAARRAATGRRNAPGWATGLFIRPCRGWPRSTADHCGLSTGCCQRRGSRRPCAKDHLDVRSLAD